VLKDKKRRIERKRNFGHRIWKFLPQKEEISEEYRNRNNKEDLSRLYSLTLIRIQEKMMLVYELQTDKLLF